MMTNLQKWLFGGDKDDFHIEGDQLFSLVQLTLIPCRNRRQLNIFMLALYILSMNQIVFIFYVVVLKKLEYREIINMMPIQLFLSHIHTSTIFLMKWISTHMKVLEQVKNLMTYAKGCSRKLKDRIAFESFLMRLTVYVASSIVTLHYVFFIWRGGDERHIFFLYVMKRFKKGRIFDVLFYFGLIYFMFLSFLIFLLNAYGCSHIYFQLLILKENLKKLNCRYTENESFQLHNIQYQKMIKRRLRKCWEHYLNIKSLLGIFEQISYWPIYSGSFHAILILGFTALYFSQGVHLSENPGLVSNFVGTFCAIILMSEGGQLIKDESENVYDVLLSTQWYQWNMENRRFLQMFLILTREPLFLSSFCIDQSRILYLKIFKGMYSILTCLTST